MPTIQEVRAKFPQYNDMSDTALTMALHKKFYADMPIGDFAAKIGVDWGSSQPLHGESQGEYNARHGQQPAASETPEQKTMREMYGSGKKMEGPSKMESFARGAADTLSFGFGDEMAAGIEAMTGGRSYSDALQRQRDSADVASTDNPWSYRGGQVAGAIAPGLLTGGGSAGGSLGGQVLRGAGSGAANAGVYGFGSGEGGAGNRLENAANSAVWGGLLGGAFPIVAKGIGNVIGAMTGKTASVPTTEAIKQTAQQGFKAADDMGVVLSPEGYDALASQVERAAGDAGFFPANHPQLANALAELDKYRGSPVPLSVLQDLRQKLGSAYSIQNPQQNMIMSQAIDALDNAITSINPGQVVSGDAQAAASLLDTARSNWSKFRKAEKLDNIASNAKNAVSANYTEAGAQTAIRQQLRALAKDNFKNARYFTPEERQMITEVLNGGTIENLLRRVGKYSMMTPGGAGRSALVGLIANMGFPGVGTGVAAGIGAAGTIARPISTSMSKKAFEALSAAVRNGGPVASTSRLSQPAQKVAASLLGTQTGLLGEALGSQLPPVAVLRALLGNPNARQ